MNVLIIAQHYFPEVTAAVNRLSALADSLQRHGHKVVVIAPKPNHPQGVIAEDYRGGLVKMEQVQGAEVHYTWVYTSPRKSILRRLLYYVSFMLQAVYAAYQLPGDYDVVFASSPPPLVGIAGWFIARIKSAKFVLDVRDLWPGLAVALGELRNPAVIRAARAVEQLCYDKADAIIAVTKPFQQEIQRRTNNTIPVELIPNGALPLFLETGDERDSVRCRNGWEGRFVVSYVGNIGVCQGLMHVLDAAELLRDSAPDVVFFFQGHGVVKPKLLENIKKRALVNVIVAGIVPTKEAACTMAASDSLLVPLASVPMAAQFIPSKLFDSMAVGRPVLLSVDGEARRILEDAQAGISYPAEDGKALAEAVMKLKGNVLEANAMGQRGRQYIKRHFLRANLSDRLVEFIERHFSQSSKNTVFSDCRPERSSDMPFAD